MIEDDECQLLERNSDIQFHEIDQDVDCQEESPNLMIDIDQTENLDALSEEMEGDNLSISHSETKQNCCESDLIQIDLRNLLTGQSDPIN